MANVCVGVYAEGGEGGGEGLYQKSGILVSVG